MNYDDMIRGPFVVNDNGTIDCELLHPQFGWVPFTADPNDVEEHGRAIHAYLLTKL